MEPENLLATLQEPSTCPYPELDESNLCPAVLLLSDPY